MDGVKSMMRATASTTSPFVVSSMVRASSSRHPVRDTMRPMGSLIFCVSKVNNVKMRFIDALCPPALLYLLFVTIQVSLDLSLGLLVTAGIKTLMGVAGVVILDALCGVDLGVVSWAIVATPFIVTALATSVSLGLELDKLAVSKAKETFALSPYPTSKTDDVTVTMTGAGDDYPFSTSSPL